MSDRSECLTDFDQWPCGLAVMDASGQLEKTNAFLRQWLGMDAAEQGGGVRFVDILSRAGRIYFETHLRPLLLVNGQFSEVSLELERPDGTRVAVFMNGRATLSKGRMVSAHFSMFRNEQRQAFEHELVAKRRESEAFKVLVGSSPYAIMSVRMDGTIRAWNPAAEQLFGYSEAEVIGQKFDEILVPPDDRKGLGDDLRRITSGETVRSETERLHKDGHRVQVERSIAAIHDVTQEYSGFVATYSDISARKASEAHIQTLLQEVNHRSKNLIAVVQVIARQTARMYEGSEFFSSFSKRLASLTSNQDTLLNSRGNHADLETLARSQFAHLVTPEDPRITVSGPAVQMNEATSQAIGMALFELATNAAKYGGLSKDTGSVTLSWVVAQGPDPKLEISWVESGGPPVSAPERMGFGSQVTGPILQGITSGETQREFQPDGFRWFFRAPLAKMTE